MGRFSGGVSAENNRQNKRGIFRITKILDMATLKDNINTLDTDSSNKGLIKYYTDYTLSIIKIKGERIC